jgi:RHS repeat-associated protein
VTGLTLGNGLVETRELNARYEPLVVASGPVSLGYTPSAAGDLVGVNDGTARTLRYDYLDRLVDSPGWVSYGYDGNGNRVSETVAGAPLSYAFSYDRLTRADVPGSTSARYTFAYDYQGNVSAIASFAANGTATGGVCLRHDALGRLTLAGTHRSPAYVGPGGTSCFVDSDVAQVRARFKYDGRNRRIARWTAAENRWTYVVGDASGNPLSELALVAGAWVRVRDYVWLDGRPLAQVEYPGPSGSSEGYVYYFHTDHLGLPRALTNQAGQEVWRAALRPYGDLDETTTADPLSGRTVVTNLRLPGQYDERLFAAAGLSGMQGPYYNWNRWYLPSLGRYLELDPIALRGKFNSPYRPDWYNYVDGNPLRYVDPFGLYGTNSCQYYTDRCAQTGDVYYCHIAPIACENFPGGYTPVGQCIRKCLQDRDKDRPPGNKCEPLPSPYSDPKRGLDLQWDHDFCWVHCALDPNANPLTDQSQPNDP